MSTTKPSTTSTTASAAAAKSSDAQTWIYPPPGAAAPPVAATSNFGPVHYADNMVLEWAPGTKPQISLTCFSQSNKQTTVQLAAAGVVSSPFNYTFSAKPAQNSVTDKLFCHFYFTPSVMGNTVTWEYLNAASVKPASWASGNSKSGSSSSPSASESSTSSSSTSVSEASATATLSSSITPNSSLSSGAAAGIGIGVALLVIAVFAGALLCFFKKRKNKAEKQQPPGELDAEPLYSHSIRAQSQYAQSYHSPSIRAQSQYAQSFHAPSIRSQSQHTQSFHAPSIHTASVYEQSPTNFYPYQKGAFSSAPVELDAAIVHELPASAS